jgi:hypothetical protein
MSVKRPVPKLTRVLSAFSITIGIIGNIRSIVSYDTIEQHTCIQGNLYFLEAMGRYNPRGRLDSTR